MIKGNSANGKWTDAKGDLQAMAGLIQQSFGRLHEQGRAKLYELLGRLESRNQKTSVVINDAPIEGVTRPEQIEL